MLGFDIIRCNSLGNRKAPAMPGVCSVCNTKHSTGRSWITHFTQRNSLDSTCLLLPLNWRTFRLLPRPAYCFDFARIPLLLI